MKKEIEFLRKQIQSRDELLFQNHSQKDSHSNIFLQPKKTVRPSIQNEPIITCSNRHDALLQDANDLNNKDNDIEITPQKFDNVTKKE